MTALVILIINYIKFDLRKLAFVLLLLLGLLELHRLVQGLLHRHQLQWQLELSTLIQQTYLEFYYRVKPKLTFLSQELLSPQPRLSQLNPSPLRFQQIQIN